MSTRTIEIFIVISALACVLLSVLAFVAGAMFAWNDNWQAAIYCMLLVIWLDMPKAKP